MVQRVKTVVQGRLRPDRMVCTPLRPHTLSRQSHAIDAEKRTFNMIFTRHVYNVMTANSIFASVVIAWDEAA